MSQETNIARESARAFVENYGRTWEEWDFAGFVDLFSDEVIYVAHATEEAVVGREALATYIRKEAEEQGEAKVRVGNPVIDGDRVAVEFWVTRTNDGQDWTTAGCLIARLGPDGRCDFFREYWFDVEGHTGAYEGWGEQATMSQENVEIVRQLYSAMNARDVEAFAELADPDVEWIPDSRVGQGPIRGRENIIRFFVEQAETFVEFRLEPERFWDPDDKVLVFVRTTGRGATSGAGFDIRIGHLWTLRDGVVVRGEGHANRDEALEAAGLREQRSNHASFRRSEKQDRENEGVWVAPTLDPRDDRGSRPVRGDKRCWRSGHLSDRCVLAGLWHHMRT